MRLKVVCGEHKPTYVNIALAKLEQTGAGVKAQSCETNKKIMLTMQNREKAIDRKIRQIRS